MVRLNPAESKMPARLNLHDEYIVKEIQIIAGNPNDTPFRSGC